MSINYYGNDESDSDSSGSHMSIIEIDDPVIVVQHQVP